MIGYSFEYQGTLGDVGTGRWQRSDQSVSSTTSTEKVIGRARTLKGVVDEAANGRRKSRAIVGGAQYVFVWQLVDLIWQLVELIKSSRVPHGNRRKLGLRFSNL